MFREARRVNISRFIWTFGIVGLLSCTVTAVPSQAVYSPDHADNSVTQTVNIPAKHAIAPAEVSDTPANDTRASIAIAPSGAMKGPGHSTTHNNGKESHTVIDGQSDSSSPDAHKRQQDNASTYDEDSNDSNPDFAPELLWNNGMSALDFPVNWLRVSNQGTILMGSLFSKSISGYSIFDGVCLGRLLISTPAVCPPVITGSDAIICDSSTALYSFKPDTLQFNWQRLPLRPPRSGNDLRNMLPRPRTSKTEPLMYNDKIVSMNTDGMVLFYHNESPEKGSFPDFAILQTSPDEAGTFKISPTIKRQVLYASTTVGHLHYLNLKNLQEFGVIKNQAQTKNGTISKEVRVPLVTSSNSLYLTTMDGTINCYSLFHKFSGQKFEAPKLSWTKTLPSKHKYHGNRWGLPVIRPVINEERNALYACTKDGVHALDCDTGETLWHHPMPQGLSCAPLLWSQYVLIVSEPKGKIPAKLTALDPADGHTIASQELRGAPTCEPVIWKNFFVVGYRNGYAECYLLGEDKDKYEEE